MFKDRVPSADRIRKINDTQIYSAKFTDVVMLIHNLIECSNDYLKESRSLWQYYRDELALTNAGATFQVIVLRLNLMKK